MDVVDSIHQFAAVLLILTMLNTVYVITLISTIIHTALKKSHPLACHKILADGKEQSFINTRHKLF